MRHDQQPTTIAIFGSNAMAEDILAWLLEEEDYSTRLLDPHPTGLIDELLDGVDVLLLVPGPHDAKVRRAFLEAVRTNPKTAHIPFISLSPALRLALIDELAANAPWQSLFEELLEEIEAAPGRIAASGKGNSIQCLGDALTAPQENAPYQPQPERYCGECIHLPADQEAARVVLRRVFKERSRCGWKLASATKKPSGDALLLEWDTLRAFSK